MSYNTILYDVSDGIATITLNRPDRMNAFNDEMTGEWAQAIDAARLDDAVSVVIVTGAGRAFCAGGDVRRYEEANSAGDRLGLGSEVPPAERRNSLRFTVHRVARALEILDKPYIAAINGPAVGAGMDMASMADLRFASDQARFAMSYVKVGLIPGDGGAWLLPRLVGLAKALELIWTGDTIDAQEALRIGYVSAVVPHDDLMAYTRAFARRLVEGPAVAIQLAKRLVYRGRTVPFMEGLEQAQAAMTIVQSTEDAIEGPRAFREKRPPQFKGR
jgi:2-(1,2-epoxy-1,2-dihydrophenyl)acetyl-CoA isomerase